jgi:hypothetical protein
MESVDEFSVQTECWLSDVVPFERWEATSVFFPETVGIGATELESVADFTKQLNERSYQ